MKRFQLNSKQTATAAVGWIGALLILIAYATVSFELMRPDSISWQVMNLVGSAGLVMAATSKKDWPPVALNVVFAVIALLAIVRIVV